MTRTKIVQKHQNSTKVSDEYADIYNIENDTVEICIQGGIVAARTLSAVFMVHSISAVATADKVGREQERRGNSSGGEDRTGANNFSKVLQQEIEERKSDTVQCKTVTYGRDSRLHPFEYFKRDYNLN